MNKKGNGNVLSSKMVSELYRHLESYRVNDNIKMVYMDSLGEDFSIGQDMKYVHEMISSGEHGKAVRYLKRVNEFGLYMG